MGIRDTMSMTLKAMAMADLAQTLTQIKSFRPFLVVPAEEVTNIINNTNPFTLGVAEAARCLGAVNFSNLDRYKFFSRLTSYLVIKKKNRKKTPEIPQKKKKKKKKKK